MLTLVPAYGRDYKSAEAAIADFNAGKDFLSVGFGMPAQGLATNKPDLVKMGTELAVRIRYNKQTKITTAAVA